MIEQDWPLGYLKTLDRCGKNVNVRLRADLPGQAVLVAFKRRERVD
ncbi:hypothetical protein [Azoarcus sp. CIB]|nr:hypothetical protein [Azoarcus sp. CIB]